MSKKRIVIMGGGTINHVRNHLALCAPAYGGTARTLATLVDAELKNSDLASKYQVDLVLTKMADHTSGIETNADVKAFVEKLIVDPTVKAIIFNVALADFEGSIDDQPSGKYETRLRTAHGVTNMQLNPSDKIIGMIRKTRKDIFVVGFKTTADQSSQTQYTRALELLKSNSLNLAVANDTVTRNNMIVAPEETRYNETKNRTDVLTFLTKMLVSRMQNTFTRSTVVDAPAVAWNSTDVPDNLRTVVNHCIEKGAYKPVLGKTAGHFAVKVNHSQILTSIRKTNFNQLDDVGLVKVESTSPDEVIAYGARPSVGGQSQRIIFKEHPELDCIVHFHCPIKNEAPLAAKIPVKDQWPNECGSHQCGQNTSNGLRNIDLGDNDSLSVVFLDSHGPNIVFNRKTPAHKVMAFIDSNFDLSAKTGGLLLQQ